jgi:hypothetical protein
MSFLNGFGFVSLDLFSFLPGTDCLMKGYVWSLYGNTMAAVAFTAAILGLWYYKKMKKDVMAWKVRVGSYVR